MLDVHNRNYSVVHAFTDESIGGNPAAVFHRSEGLDAEEMQRIARQLNFVETVFISPSEQAHIDRHLRFFAPSKELPVAGHPSVAAWASLAHDGEISPERSVFFQKTLAGVQQIEISKRNELLVVFMQQEPPRFLNIETDRNLVTKVFGIDQTDLNPNLPIQTVDTGLGHVIVPINDLNGLMKAVRNIEPLKEFCARLGAREAQLFCLEARNPDLDLHTRNLSPREGLEDPACGVGNGALGAYLARHHFGGQSETYLKAEQGHVVNMPSVVHIKAMVAADNYKISIGGSAKIVKKEVFEFAL